MRKILLHSDRKKFNSKYTPQGKNSFVDGHRTLIGKMFCKKTIKPQKFGYHQHVNTHENYTLLLFRYFFPKWVRNLTKS